MIYYIFDDKFIEIPSFTSILSFASHDIFYNKNVLILEILSKKARYHLLEFDGNEFLLYFTFSFLNRDLLSPNGIFIARYLK